MKRLLVTWFHLGYLRPAPGTWGSLGAVVPFAALWLIYRALGGGVIPPVWQVAGLLAGAVAACAVGVALGPWALEHFRQHRPPASFGKDSAAAEHDPSAFVLDEVAGQWLALAFVPVCQASPAALLLHCGLAFIWFRVFDIVKLPPARRLERLPHGWGICCDDMAAGLYAGLVSRACLWLGAWLWPAAHVFARA